MGPEIILWMVGGLVAGAMLTIVLRAPEVAFYGLLTGLRQTLTLLGQFLVQAGRAPWSWRQ